MKISKDMVKLILDTDEDSRNSDLILGNKILKVYDIDINDMNRVKEGSNIKRYRAYRQNTRGLFAGDPEIMLKRYKHSREYANELRAKKTDISNKSLLSRLFRKFLYCERKTPWSLAEGM